MQVRNVPLVEPSRIESRGGRQVGCLRLITESFISVEAWAQSTTRHRGNVGGTVEVYYPCPVYTGFIILNPPVQKEGPTLKSKQVTDGPP